MDTARLGLRACAAALLIAVLWVAMSPARAVAEQGASATPAAAGAKDAVSDAGQAAPPSDRAADQDSGERTDLQTHGAALRRNGPRKGDVGRVDHGAYPSPNRGRAGNTPNLDTLGTRAAPVPHAARTSARDRLFKLIQTMRHTHATHVRPANPNPAAARGPLRNAIGLRIDAGAGSGGANALPAGQGPLSPNRMAGAPLAPPGVIHPGFAQPSAPARGTVNGTSVVRVGAGTSVIGGPARIATGINGTTIRSKH